MTLALNLVSILLSLVAVGASTVLLVRQTVFMRHANEISASVSLYQEFRTDEFQRAQNFVLDSLAANFDPEQGLSDLADEARGPSFKVAAFYTSLGGLVVLGLVDERFAVSLLGVSAHRCWNVLEPYIFREREVRHDRDILAFYEDFVCRIRQNFPVAEAYGLKLMQVASDERHPPVASQSKDL